MQEQFENDVLDLIDLDLDGLTEEQYLADKKTIVAKYIGKCADSINLHDITVALAKLLSNKKVDSVKIKVVEFEDRKTKEKYELPAIVASWCYGDIICKYAIEDNTSEEEIYNIYLDILSRSICQS